MFYLFFIELLSKICYNIAQLYGGIVYKYGEEEFKEVFEMWREKNPEKNRE